MKMLLKRQIGAITTWLPAVFVDQSLRQMTRKWASISTAGRLKLNTVLLYVPRSLGEYIIVHELVHLITPNHANVLISFLYAFLPDWEDRANRLPKILET